MKCWAEILGGCAGGLSREHYLTKGLYSGNVKAEGLPWSRGQSIDLPINALAANILCRHHNGMLSCLDAEAIRLKDFVVDAVQANSASHVQNPETQYCTVDGRKVVGWFCKVICNLNALAKQPLDPVYLRRSFGLPNSPVQIYVDRILPSGDENDVSHFRFWQWHADLKAGGRTAVYLMRLAVLEWLVAPFALTQDECDALGQLTNWQCWFKPIPVFRTRIIPIGHQKVGRKPTWTHQLIVKCRR